jgi:hypothetical protein
MRLSSQGLAALTIAILWALSGCPAPPPATDPPEVTPSPPPCPPGMVHVPGGRADLGEWDPARIAADPYQPEEGFSSAEILRKRSVEVAPFCMDEYPFPGKVGDTRPGDGLSWQDTVVFDIALSRFGRRLCSVEELLYAAAGPDNWRYPYDREQWRDGVCIREDPIGGNPECVSPLGLHDLQIDSTWARLEDPELRELCGADLGGTRRLPGGGSYAIWGGNMFQDTFYAPSNFGIHFHGPHEGGYDDDSTRTCAEPGTWTEDDQTAWKAFTDDFRETGRFQVLLYGPEDEEAPNP